MEIAAIAGGVVVAFVIAGVAIWLVPRRQVAGWRRAGITDEVKLAELGVQARSSIVQALGGLALIVTLAITISQVNETRKSAERAQRSADNNLRLSERGQVAERFSKGVEQLGDAAADVRTGALFSLMRVGLDSPEENAEPVFLTAATFVSRHYVPPSPLPDHGCKARFNVPVDVSTALRFVLPRIAPVLLEQHPGKRLVGLRGANLSGLAIDNLALRRFELTGIRFQKATLASADFDGSNLTNAKFDRACLGHASFQGATLVGADFEGAELKQADFRDANLEGASFRGAKMNKATFSKAALAQVVLSPAQLDEISLDG